MGKIDHIKIKKVLCDFSIVFLPFPYTFVDFLSSLPLWLPFSLLVLLSLFMLACLILSCPVF